MYFQLVESQVLSTQGQPDWVNLHRLTAGGVDLLRDVEPLGAEEGGDLAERTRLVVGVQVDI